jgi:hypothetical protein
MTYWARGLFTVALACTAFSVACGGEEGSSDDEEDEGQGGTTIIYGSGGNSVATTGGGTTSSSNGGSTSSSGGTSGGSGGSDAGCPDQIPFGQACSDTGLQCTYEFNGSTWTCQCFNQTWICQQDATGGAGGDATGGTGNDDNCPTSQPADGSQCFTAGAGTSCDYGGTTCTCQGQGFNLTWDCGGGQPQTGGAGPGTGGRDPGTGGQEPGTGGQEPGTGGTEPSTGGGANEDCPTDRPANGTACSVDSGTACIYGPATCYCTGNGWFCGE